MTELDRILLRRADEQVSERGLPPAGRDDRAVSGSDLIRTCPVPGCSRPVPSTGGPRKLCDVCRGLGRVAYPCKGCGGPLRRLDVSGIKNRERRGYCSTCRADMPQVYRGAETIAHARAVFAQRCAARSL